MAIGNGGINGRNRCFHEAYALTMGIGTIMRAKKILMLVSGTSKAEILDQMIHGRVTPKIPASILQFHPNVTVIADEAACSVINRRRL